MLGDYTFNNSLYGGFNEAIEKAYEKLNSQRIPEEELPEMRRYEAAIKEHLMYGVKIHGIVSDMYGASLNNLGEVVKLFA
jgi:hypothetical protein